MNEITTIYLATPFRYKSNPYLIGFNEIDSHTRRVSILRGMVYEKNVDDARNLLVEDFLDKTKDNIDSWLCFIDDDILLTTDTFDLFLQYKNQYKSTKFFYGDYALKKRTYESAHIVNGDKIITIASGLNFIHRSVFTELESRRVTSNNIDSLTIPYRWYICAMEKDSNVKSGAGEDSYFTQLCLSRNIIPKCIHELVGIHVDFEKRAAFGPDHLVRNGKIKYEYTHIYAISKNDNPIYNNICENEIEIDRLFFKKTKALGKIAVLTPRRYTSTPIISNLHINPMRNQYNIDMHFYTISETPRDVSRNQLIEKALEDNVDYIFFLDDDNIVDFDCINILMEAEEDIIGLNYSLKKPFYESVHLIENPVNNTSVNQIPISKDTKGKVDISRVIGMGATLINADVFKNINSPWFQEHSDETQKENEYLDLKDGTKITFTDDSFFTTLLVKAGYTPKVLADVHSGHIDFETFNVYGHPDIVNNKTAKLKNLKNIRWALSEDHKKELIENHV